MSAFSRLLANRGEVFALTTFTEGARDSYGDVAYSGSSESLAGIRSEVNQSTRVFKATTGEERLVDMTVLVLAGTVPNNEGTDRAAELTDSSGQTYKVMGVGRAGAPVGSNRVFCEMVVT